MNTFAKSFLSLTLGLGLCAGAHAQSAPADAHKSPVKVNAPKVEAPKAEAPKNVTKAEVTKNAAKAEATKAAPAKPASDKPTVAQKTEVKTVKEHKPAVSKEPAHAAAAPTAAKVLPKTESQPAKPAK